MLYLSREAKISMGTPGTQVGLEIGDWGGTKGKLCMQTPRLAQKHQNLLYDSPPPPTPLSGVETEFLYGTALAVLELTL